MGSILAVWVGVRNVRWLLLTDASVGVFLRAVSVVGGSVFELYVTTR